jgi:hypothetical protein
MRALLTLAVFKDVAVNMTPVAAAEAIQLKEIPALEVAMKCIGPALKMAGHLQVHTSLVCLPVVMWKIAVLRNEASVSQVVNRVGYHW